jgi:GMP synthase-like glutamine amidotransferase
VLVVQHEPDTGPGWVGTWLAEAGVDLDVRHPYRPTSSGGTSTPASALPDAVEGWAGLVVLGGAMGPLEDDRCPWLPATRALLADAVARGVPTLGICLGAELLAVACGGEVRRGAAGPELGVLGVDPLPASADDPVFAALRPGSRVLQWHWEEISRLPEGSTLLATSVAYLHQAFRVGRCAWAVQGHPEVTAEIAAAWAREDSPMLLAAGRAPEELVAEVRLSQPSLVASWRPVTDAFARVVHDGPGPGRRRLTDASASPLPPAH